VGVEVVNGRSSILLFGETNSSSSSSMETMTMPAGHEDARVESSSASLLLMNQRSLQDNITTGALLPDRRMKKKEVEEEKRVEIQGGDGGTLAAAPIDSTTLTTELDSIRRRSLAVSKAWMELDVKHGVSDHDTFGTPSCLSGDGMILAVGAIDSDPSGTSSGSVHVYMNDGNGKFEQQIGTALILPNNSDEAKFGWSLSLSDNGDVLAVGAPGENMVRLYYNDNGAGYKLFRDYLYGGWNSDFGHSVSLSGDGKWLAVGAPDNSYVKIYTDVDSTAGTVYAFQTLRGTIGFGYSVSLSDDGHFLGIGTSDPAGSVLIFARGTGGYTERCDDIRGQAVSFASNSKRFAVRDIGKGEVKVYEINGGVCDAIHIGAAPINTATAVGPRDETLLSLSDDGKLLAIADTRDFKGTILVYERVPSTIGVDNFEYQLRGDFINVLGSQSVSLSDTGDLVAIGTPSCMGNDGNKDKGCSYVYGWILQTSPPTPNPTLPPTLVSYLNETTVSSPVASIQFLLCPSTSRLSSYPLTIRFRPLLQQSLP
jgi:WD40 repeat protein